MCSCHFTAHLFKGGGGVTAECCIITVCLHCHAGLHVPLMFLLTLQEMVEAVKKSIVLLQLAKVTVSNTLARRCSHFRK